MSRFRSIAVLCLICWAIAYLISPVLKGDATECGLGWRVVPSPNAPPAGSAPVSSLTAVSAISPTEAWAVGSANVIGDGQIALPNTFAQRWDGTTWQIVATPNASAQSNYLNGVAAVATNDVWAVGNYRPNGSSASTQTLTEHWDGTMWTIVPMPNVGSGLVRLNAVSAVSHNDVWAVGSAQMQVDGVLIGDDPLIEHWDGTQWSVVPSPTVSGTTGALLAVAAVSVNDVWAVGYSRTSLSPNQTLIEHWDGTSWKIVSSPVPEPVNGHLTGVAAVSANDVWAVGYSGGDDMIPSTTRQALIEHWDGTKWTVVTAAQVSGEENTLVGVTASSANEVWAVGWHASKGSEADSQPLVEHWDGNSWTIVSVPSPQAGASRVRLLAASALSKNDVWAAGDFAAPDGTDTLVEHYNDPCFVPPTPTPTATATPRSTPSPTATASPTATTTPSATASPSPTVTPTATPSPTPAPAQLMNISTRLRVGTGDNALIGGFIITGNESKRIIVRAVGPSLAFNGTPVPGRLQDPLLELHDKDGALITSNDNWRDAPNSDEIQASGVAPSDDRESAILRLLGPNLPFTAVVRGKDNSTGIALAEAYDLSPKTNSRLANISTRGLVETGDNVLIGGFIVGNHDSTSKVVVRGIGPSLASKGVPDALQDPTLELHDSNGATFAGNDNWQDDPGAAEIEADQLAPEDARESATIQTLPPGGYTAILRGKADSTGVALVEIYNVQ